MVLDRENRLWIVAKPNDPNSANRGGIISMLNDDWNIYKSSTPWKYDSITETTFSFSLQGSSGALSEKNILGLPSIVTLGIVSHY